VSRFSACVLCPWQLVATGKFFHSFRFPLSFLREQVHFMRFKNSFAAAVAAAVSAVVFSAAFQPAEAGFVWYAQNVTSPSAGVRIDGQGFFNTTTLTGSTFLAGSSQTDPVVQSVAIANGPYAIDEGGDLSRYTGAFLSSSGTLVSQGLFDAATFVNPTTNSGDMVKFNIRNNPANFFLYVDPAYVSGSPLTNTMFFPGVSMASTFGWTAGTYVAPASNGLWVLSNGDTVQILGVPEPTHMVFVAGIGAALGAWRLRKLRRSREAAGDAIAG
jgi:hypothetical protein